MGLTWVKGQIEAVLPITPIMMVFIPYLHNFKVKIGWKCHLCQRTKRRKLSLTLSRMRSGSLWLSPPPPQYLVPNQYLRLGCMTEWLTLPKVCSVLFCIDGSGLPLPGQQPDLLCDNPSIYAPVRRSGNFVFKGGALWLLRSWFLPAFRLLLPQHLKDSQFYRNIQSQR